MKRYLLIEFEDELDGTLPTMNIALLGDRPGRHVAMHYTQITDADLEVLRAIHGELPVSESFKPFVVTNDTWVMLANPQETP